MKTFRLPRAFALFKAWALRAFALPGIAPPTVPVILVFGSIVDVPLPVTIADVPLPVALQDVALSVTLADIRLPVTLVEV